MAKSILLMWSGGISSTAILFQLLTESEYKDYDIIVHHCHIIDICNKAVAEAKACKQIVDYVSNKRKYRKFFLSESKHDYSFISPPRYSRNINDLDMVSFMASQIVAGNRDIQYVVMGGSLTDAEYIENHADMLARSQKIMYEALVIERDGMDVVFDYPYQNIALTKILASLPRNIKKKPWSCMFPSYKEDGTPVKCGKCVKCLMQSEHGIK